MSKNVIVEILSFSSVSGLAQAHYSWGMWIHFTIWTDNLPSFLMTYDLALSGNQATQTAEDRRLQQYNEDCGYQEVCVCLLHISTMWKLNCSSVLIIIWNFFLSWNRYMNQYPLLGLLSDDYQYTAPIKEDRTVVIESTGVTSRVI